MSAQDEPSSQSQLDAVKQLRVKFVAKQQRYAVTDTPILVPATLRRYGLSEVVNHLLGNTDSPVPFDFLVDGAFLRATSLIAYLQENGLSPENIITLEYIESVLPPSQLSSLKHDDWVSSVAGHQHQSLFLTGSYDNVVRIWNAAGQCAATARGHSQAVKDVAWLYSETPAAAAAAAAETSQFLSASQDGSVIAWEVDSADPAMASVEEARIMYEARGHTGGVEAISVSGDGRLFASASSDATLRVWSVAFNPEEEAEQHVEAAGSSKRRKTKDTDRPRKAALDVLTGHVGAVCAVTFNKSTGALYSGGWDHSVRVWDVETRTNITTKNCEKVVNDVDHSPLAGLIASGHSDHVLRLWDPRAEDASILKLSLSAHKNWISSVSWSPSNAYMLASGSYDGSVKVWDIRSRTPLYTVYDNKSTKQEELGPKPTEKVLAVDWAREYVLSGGESAELRIHKLSTDGSKVDQ